MAVTHTSQHFERTPGISSTPPIEPTGAPIEGPPPLWPTFIGIIAIIIGAGGTLAYGFGLVSSLVMALVADTVQEGGLDEVNSVQFETAREFVWWNMLSGAVSLALAIVLLSAGIGLVRKRPKSVTWLTMWGIARLVWSIPVLIMTFVVMTQQFSGMDDAMQQSGAATPNFVTTILEVMPAVALIIGALWAWSLPTFILVWFRRARIRAEVDAWRKA